MRDADQKLALCPDKIFKTSTGSGPLLGALLRLVWLATLLQSGFTALFKQERRKESVHFVGVCGQDVATLWRLGLI